MCSVIFVIGIILIILAVVAGGVYLAFLAKLIFGVMVLYGLPPIFATALINSFIMKLIPLSKISSTTSNQAILYEAVELRCELNAKKPKIKAYVSQEKLKDIIKENIPSFFKIFPFLSFSLGTLAGVFVSIYMFKNGYISSATLDTPQNKALYLGAEPIWIITMMLTAVSSLIFTLLLSPSFKLKSRLIRNFRVEMKKLYGKIEKLIAQIKEISNDNWKAEELLGSYPSFFKYISKAEERILKNRCDIINNPSLIVSILQETYKEAKQERDRIEKMLELYSKTKELLNMAENVKSSVLNLIFPNKRIKELKEALSGNNIAHLISQNKWNECFKYIENIKKEAEAILRLEDEEK